MSSLSLLAFLFLPEWPTQWLSLTGCLNNKLLSKINSELNAFACLFLDVHSKIIHGALQWLWHGAWSPHHAEPHCTPLVVLVLPSSRLYVGRAPCVPGRQRHSCNTIQLVGAKAECLSMWYGSCCWSKQQEGAHLEGWDMLYNIHFMLCTTFLT